MADSLQDIVDELEELSPDEIALKLKEMGIRGYINAPRACPVTNYIKAQKGGGHIATSKTNIVYWQCLSEHSSDHTKCPSPELVLLKKNVANFIEQFDDHLYLDLVQGIEQ